MASGLIDFIDVVPVGTNKLKVMFMFYPGNTYDFREHTSLRLYWRIKDTSVNESIDVTPQNADVYRQVILAPVGYTYVEYTITGLYSNTTYLVRPYLRLFKKPGSANIVFTAKSPEKGPVEVTTKEYSRTHPLFEIATYPDDTGSQTEGAKITKFVDFTNYVIVPSYDVNSTDVNEDWQDADYVTHRIVVREKITGKFNVRFTSITDYNNFMDAIYQNRVVNGKGYTELRVQVNNRLDYESGISIGQTACMQYIGKFFVKIDSNPYAEPYYGHYDKYNDVSVSIEEA